MTYDGAAICTIRKGFYYGVQYGILNQELKNATKLFYQYARSAKK